MKKKELKFSAELVPFILSGEKTSTWRLFDDKDLQTGDEVIFIKRPELEPFATAILTEVTEKPFGQLTKEDKQGHEQFASYEEMYATLSRYYNHPVAPETPVKIIKFKLQG